MFKVENLKNKSIAKNKTKQKKTHQHQIIHQRTTEIEV